MRCSSQADCTAQLQQAFNRSGSVELSAGATYVAQPLFVTGRQREIRLRAGCTLQARAGYFHGIHDMLLTITGADGVTLAGEAGGGALLRMNKPEYLVKKSYTRSEWRHALGLYDSARVHIRHLQIASAGGDGIYVAGLTSSAISFVDISDSFRNAMSIISATNLEISSCTFADTPYKNGTAPRVG